MINADEHKKLLEQVNELGRNSINYFDVEKEFFLIDSDNLPQTNTRSQANTRLNDSLHRQDLLSIDMDADDPSQVRTRLYGYSIQATGIYEDDNLTPEAVDGLDGRGAYVYVGVKDDKITIKQDINGCWGIYLFRHGDYFALSNSFFRLVDHVKFKYPLTLNRDYCHHLMLSDLCSHSYSETAANEIRLVERNAIIQIDKSKKTFDIEWIDYKEHTVPLDSPEAMTTLDNWVSFWANVLRGLAQHTPFIQSDLSGGFDSRMSLLVLLNSDIDLNKIKINSAKSTAHTFKEDYEIASKIAAHYGFKLNRSLPERKVLNYSLADVWNLSTYAQQPFHKMSYLNSTGKAVDKLYCIKGFSGETIRGNWLRFNQSPKEFTETQALKANVYSTALSRELSRATRNIFKSTFQVISKKYKITDEDSHYLVQYLYQETRARNHYGKEFILNYFRNNIVLAPTLDPQLHTVKFDTPQWADPRLLTALIYVRYEPDLLKFPFDSKRLIVPETVDYAKKINEQFPRQIKHDKIDLSRYALLPRDDKAEQIRISGKNNPAIPGDLPQRCLKAAFESSKTYGLFTSCFDAELYKYAAAYYEEHVFGRERPMYGVIGVAKIIEDVAISQSCRLPYQDMQRILEQDFSTLNTNEIQLPDKFKRYLTVRIEIKLNSTAGDFLIQSVSDDKAIVRKPRWLQKEGIGYQINSCAGHLTFTAQTAADGKISLNLRGIDVRSAEDKTKRIPYWIDYTKFSVNGEVIFDKVTPAWHNKPYRYNMDVKAGEEITVEVEWLPHRSDT